MIRKRTTFRLITLSSTLTLATALLALPVPRSFPQTAPDNTKMNPADRALTKKIRSSIYQDKSLSTYAHNIKVITQNGAVTLKGPVRSDDEKANIEAKATAIAGAGNVTDQLTVAPPKS